MTTWALVPIKPRELCKTRLAAVLQPREREALVRSVLLHVLATLRAAPGVDHVAVVSSEREDIPDDVSLLLDEGADLNSSLEKGIGQALEAGASMLLIVPADLPLLRVEDVVQMLAAARLSGIALAPDRHERGTNALCMRSSARLSMQFGRNSFAKHTGQAATLYGEAVCVRSPTLGFDLDTVADWRWFTGHHRTLAGEFVTRVRRPVTAGGLTALNAIRPSFRQSHVSAGSHPRTGVCSASSPRLRTSAATPRATR